MADLVIALSLANLCYLRVWSELLTYTPANTFWMKRPPESAQYAAVVLNVVLAGILLWPLVRRARRTGPASATLAQWSLLLVLLIPANGVREVLGNLVPYLKSPLFEVIGRAGVATLVAGLVVVFLWAVAHWRRQLIATVCAVLLLVSPFVPITFVQAGWKAATYDAGPFADKPLAHPIYSQAAPGPRILWVIFDEWDYRLSFVDRPANIHLPEVDRFEAESLRAANAYPPGEGTPTSIPSLVMGRIVTGVREDGVDELMLTLRDPPRAVRWSAQPTLFSRARSLGINTAVVGWFHPYCRLLNRDLTACRWWELAMQHNSMGDTFGEILRNQTRSLFESTLLSPFGQSLATRQHVRTYQAALGEAVKVATDRSLGVVLLHLPVPHAPHAYDRVSHQFTLSNAPIEGYWDSLELMDRTLGQLRRTMEESGVWESSAILLSSDHSYREAQILAGRMDGRVPLLLKLPGHHAAVTYESPFNTVLTADLLTAIATREVADPAGAAAWLDRHRSLVVDPIPVRSRTGSPLARISSRKVSAGR
jgi:hypothetical protein